MVSKYVDKKEQPFLYYIEWIDHCGSSDPGWHLLDSVTTRDPEMVSSVGWVMSDTEESICLVPTLSFSGYCQGGLTILKNCIKKAIRLKDPKKWEIN